MAEKTEKKSILEEALLEANEIQKTAQNNAKEILASQMKPEIDRIVKEAIEKEDSIDEEESHEQTKIAKEDTEKVKEDDDNNDLDDQLEEPEQEIVDKPEDIEDAGVDQVDLTNSPDDEVIKVFKKINDEDEVEFIKDGDSINLKDGDSEYHIQLSESEKKKGKLNEEDICECPDNLTDMGNNNDDEMIYEIELNDEELNENEPVDENKEVQEENEELEETFNVTHAEGKNVTSKPQNFNVRSRPGDTRYKSAYQESVEKNKQLVGKFNSLRSKAVKILSENKELKNKEGKYKSALVDLRNKFNQIGLFNSNLAYSARIMAEQTTTKEEKHDIISRFDKVKSINESKALYKTIIGELKKEPIKESVEKKIIKTSESGSSKQITESKVSIDPQLGRMMDLIKYSTNGK